MCFSVLFYDCNCMTYTFMLSGEVPSKKNSRVVLRGGKNIPSKNFREWHDPAIASLFCQAVKQKLREPLDCPLSVCIKFTHGDKKRRDCDNALSSILDTLTDAGIIKDDNWQIVQNIILENDYKEKESGVKITIVQL